MLTEDETLARILADLQPLAAERVPLLDALGRFAAETLFGTWPLPGFDNSSMDGYAVACASGGLPAGVELRLTGEQPAGPDLGLSVSSGDAVRIFTGAPIPAGANAVIMQEDVERSADGTVLLREGVKPGENIRRAGMDLARGQKILEAGERLSPARLGLLASQGLSHVRVHRAPRVAILPTGDELRRPGEALRPGEIYESNSVALAALAISAGAQVTILARAPDDPVSLDASLAQGLDGHDALVIAGGVSVGERDFVKERLAAASVQLHLWRVRMRPGKPFLYGRRAGGGAHVFGLPGNPVSAFVTFLLFVRPALLRLRGAGDGELALRGCDAAAAVEMENRGDRPHYIRGVLDARGQFAPAGEQESHALFGLSRSNALVRLDAGGKVLAGSVVRVLLFPD